MPSISLSHGGVSSPPPLGRLLRQRRRQQGRSLRDVATHVYKPNGAQITPQYLSEIEGGRRRPSRYVLEGLARALHLETEQLIMQGYRAESAVRDYLRLYPEQESEVIAFFRSALTHHFHHWAPLQQHIRIF